MVLSLNQLPMATTNCWCSDNTKCNCYTSHCDKRFSFSFFLHMYMCVWFGFCCNTRCSIIQPCLKFCTWVYPAHTVIAMRSKGLHLHTYPSMYIHTNEVTKDTFAHTSVSQLITERKKCPSLCDGKLSWNRGSLVLEGFFFLNCVPSSRERSEAKLWLVYPQEFFPLSRGVGLRNLKSRAQHKGEKRGKTMACITHKSSFP